MDTRRHSAIFPPQATRPPARALAGPPPGLLAPQPAQPAPAQPTQAQPAPAPKPTATEALAGRTGALVNEINFPEFVASLVHGTFDAMVDASIRQMETYSSLVSAVAKTVDQFTEENVSPNQARDWLASRYPGDIRIQPPTADQPSPTLVPAAEGLSPPWLTSYGAEGEELTTELLEERVLPQVRTHVGTERQQLLATMVMLGMNRVVIKDGSISAKVLFRAAANEAAKVGYATGSDPKSVTDWGERGSLSYSNGSTTTVSTLGINAQSDTSLRTDLFGEVRLNFASETLPLERLADMAKIALVQRHAVTARPPAPAVAVPAAPAAATPHAGEP